MTRLKMLAVVLAASLSTMGQDCINDSFLVAINIEGVSGTYALTPGTTLTWSGSTVIDPSTYLSTDAGTVQNVRVYDIRVQTIGTYSGTVTGRAQVNGTDLVTYAGSWAALNTEQSVLTSTLINRNTPGITALVNAVMAGTPITLAADGSVNTSPIPAGLSVKVTVYGQVDAEP